MEANKEAFAQVKASFVEAIDILSKEYQGSSLTDIFVVVDKESGEVVFFDDEENRIASTVVDSWIDFADKSEEDDIADSDNEIRILLRAVTEEMNEQNLFSSLEIFRPFSVNYADDSFVVIEELLLIADESSVQMDNDLIERLDRDFDIFLEKLLNN